MKTIFKTILDLFKKDGPPPKSKEEENKDIILVYNLLRKTDPNFDEPNFQLAEKVFYDFNDFELQNLDNGLIPEFIPKSLLPYPINYIKCAYYILLLKSIKEKNVKLYENTRMVGMSLFGSYTDYKKYKKNLILLNVLDKTQKDSSPREAFKKLYGVYEISEEEYNSSPNSIDSTDEKLIHDFGFLPEIEKDFDMS